MKTLSRLLVATGIALALVGSASAARVPDGVTSITIHSAGVGTWRVTNPENVQRIVNWFDRLPHFSAASCPAPAETPPDVTFTFRKAGGGTLLVATDHLAGTCGGEIDGTAIPLADHGFVERVSELIGIELNPSAKTQQNKAAAQADIPTLLGLVTLPDGARPLAKFSTTSTQTRWGAYVSAHRAWNVHMSLWRVYKFEFWHRPAGSSWNGSGSSWKRSNGRRTITERDVWFSLPAVAGQLSGRVVEISVHRMLGGWTRLTVDLSDGWLVVRSPNETVPDGVSKIVIDGLPRLRRQFTDSAQVAKIVHWFNSIPEAQPLGPFSCDAGIEFGPPPPLLNVSFRAADGTEVATSSGHPYSSECEPLTFGVGGAPEPDLIGGSLLRRIERLPH